MGSTTSRTYQERKGEADPMKSPLCAYCFDGVVVYKGGHDVYACNKCLEVHKVDDEE